MSGENQASPSNSPEQVILTSYSMQHFNGSLASRLSVFLDTRSPLLKLKKVRLSQFPPSKSLTLIMSKLHPIAYPLCQDPTFPTRPVSINFQFSNSILLT